MEILILCIKPFVKENELRLDEKTIMRDLTITNPAFESFLIDIPLVANVVASFNLLQFDCLQDIEISCWFRTLTHIEEHII